MAIKKENIQQFLEQVVSQPLEVYSLDFRYSNNHYLIEINLDNLDDPRGSVSISDCEKVSRELTQFLETSFAEENYTIQVSSAGAERPLRLPGDLGRFKGVPVKLHILDKDGKNVSYVLKITAFDGETVTCEPLDTKSKKQMGKQLLIQSKDIVKGNLYVKI